MREAVAEVVGKQRASGIDIVSDGEMSKVGFSNYVMQRYSGFANRAQFVATDLGEFPEIVNKLFVENEAAAPGDAERGGADRAARRHGRGATSTTSRPRSARRRRTTRSSRP